MGKIWAYFVCSVVTLIHISPLFVIVFNALRTNESITKQGLLALPDVLHLENFAYVWKVGNYFSAYKNSLIVGLVAAFVVMLFTGMAAYGMVKANAYGQKFLNGYFIIALSIPYFAMMVPVFYLFYKIGLTNSLVGITLIYIAINIPFNFIFVYAYFQGLPRDIDEAARIDGASELQNFFYNTLPLAKPIMTSVLLIVFVNCWNEYMFANLFLQKQEVLTVAMKFNTFVGSHSTEYAYMYMGAVITILPIVVMYLLMQNTFIEGMTSGSVKG
jgi:raffinose/stachyose/melibiose transport system permease protein